jgi:hypothetical protein
MADVLIKKFNLVIETEEGQCENIGKDGHHNPGRESWSRSFPPGPQKEPLILDFQTPEL